MDQLFSFSMTYLMVQAFSPPAPRRRDWILPFRFGVVFPFVFLAFDPMPYLWLSYRYRCQIRGTPADSVR